MKKIFVFLSAALLVSVLSAIPAAASEDVQDTAVRDRLIIATTDNGPVSIDRLLYIALRNIRYSADFICPIVREGYERADDGTCDGVIAGYPELETVYTNLRRVPVPLENINVRVFAKEDSELFINSWDELGGLRVGILENRTYILERLPADVAITERETNKAVLSGLADGDYDVAVLAERDHESFGEGLFIKRVGQVDQLIDYLYLNKKHERIIQELTAALEDMYNDGTADLILSDVPLPELNQKKTVVHIISSSVEISRQDRFTTQLRSHFEDDMSVEWITVNLDSRRFTRGQHNMAYLASLLRADIASRNVYAIIVSGDTALNFLDNYYYLYFRSVPVLFYDVSVNYKTIIRENEQHFTGIVQNIEAYQTVQQALKMFPATSEVFVLNDYTDEGERYREAAETQLAELDNSIKVTYNDNKSIDTLLEQIRALPEDAVVLVGSYFVDADHQYYTMGEMKRLMERNCSVPVFTLYSIDPPFNAVGGRCLDFRSLGDEIAVKLGYILEGGSVSDIPIEHDSVRLNRWVFDQTQLDRFNIKTNDLPEDALIVNKQLPIWETNRQFFVAIIIIMVIGAVLLIGISAFLVINYRHSRQMKKMEEAAIAASRAKSNFLANMSHEMRTPLTAVLGLTELIIETVRLDDETLSNMIKVYHAGETLLGLVNDVLDISKIEAEKFELNEREYELPSLINDTITQCSLYMGEKPIELVLNIGDDMPNYLYGDDLRIRQVMNNLLSNAFKFTKEGRVELSIDSKRENGNVRLIIRVSDTGIGIRAEDMNKLFTLYAKMEEDDERWGYSRRTEGTGLGLSISKKIAEMMNGTITVESEFGKGSTFTIEIIQKYVNDSLIGKDVADNLRNFDYSIKKFENAKMMRINMSYARVLVVDDNHTNLDVARGLLSLYGMKVDCVTDGRQAVDAVRDESIKYNAIFMDHMMPEMDGIEAARIIREEIGTEYAQNIPIIALTANAIIGNEDLFLSKGFQAFIPKPIDLTHLDTVVRQWVRDKAAEALLSERTIFVKESSGTSERIMHIGISGIDVQKGINHYGGSAEMLLEILTSFAINTRPLLDRIKDFDAGPKSGDDGIGLSEYGVIVHGIKSSCFGIFADETGNMALALEKAAGAGDIEYIAANNSVFVQDVYRLIDDIEERVNMAKNGKPVKNFPDRKLLEDFLTACGNYDIDEMDAVMAEIEKCEYSSDDGLVYWLHSNLEQGKYGEIMKKLSEILGGK